MAGVAAGTGELVELDERRLLLRHRDGEPGAFAALLDRYRAPVYSYLTRCGVTGEDRDDLFQDIFIRVHRAAHSYQAERPLHPWLFTIVANVVRTHLRRQRVRQLVTAAPVEVEPVDEGPDGERAAAARQTLEWLESEIATLPLARREVLILAAIERRPLKEVAEILGMPVNTVKTHLRRARMTLAERLAGHHRGEVRT
jgi:RNA polymerase sigma-70 factor (ECF subfamily)